jgi:hypothetical protein
LLKSHNTSIGLFNKNNTRSAEVTEKTE